MELIFFLLGAIATVAFIINNLARTALRQNTITRWELRLAFFVALMPTAALIVNNLDNARFDTLEQLAFLLIIPLAIVSIGLIVVEGFRSQRWRQSRGIFGLGIALLLLLANLFYSFLALNAQLSIVERSIVPTPVNAAPERLSPCELAFADIGTSVFDQVRDYTGLSDAALEEEFVNGSRSLGQLIEANDRTPANFTDDIVQSFEDALPNLVSLECLTPLQAAGAPLVLRTQLQNIIDTPIAELLTLFGGGQFGGDEGDEGDTADTAETLSEEQLRSTRVALLENLPTEVEAPSATPTPTVTRTPTPTVTRTPLPTLSATPTRERFRTATPTLTPTLPNPCLATASFNVNMRTQPDLDESDIVQVIPFDTVFSVFAPNDDQTWWFAQYEGEAGWISDEFIALTAPCFDLPPRQP